MAEALELGATLVTVSDNIEAISEAAGEEPGRGRFLTLDKRLTLGSGKASVEIYNISTIHANSYLLVYIPGTKTLFMADHFGTPYQDGVPVANRGTLDMATALAPLDIDYNKIVTAHGARVFSDRDFSNSVKNYKEFDCPQDRPLCSR